MRNILTILFLLPLAAIAQKVDSIYDFHGGVFHPTEIITGARIRNAIIEINPYQQFFDTTVTLEGCRMRELSTASFGASPRIQDNSVYLQKCINTCISNGDIPLYCVDSYRYSQSLTACKIVNGRYVGFGLNFYGDGDHWNQKQTLTYTGSEFAFGVQCAKGGSFRGIAIRGTNTGSGIVIDYTTGFGTTGYTVEACYVGNFDVDFDVSSKGTGNGDILHFSNIHSGKCRVAVRSSTPQNKGNEINGFYSWDSCQIAFQIKSGNWNINGGNVAKYCGQLLDWNLSGWNSSYITGLTAEFLLSLGRVAANTSIYMPAVCLSNLNIRFIPGDQVLFRSNSYNVVISNSNLWFYNGKCCQPMNFSGPWTSFKNDFGRNLVNDDQIQYIDYTPQKPVTLNTQERQLYNLSRNP